MTLLGKLPTYIISYYIILDYIFF